MERLGRARTIYAKQHKRELGIFTWNEINLSHMEIGENWIDNNNNLIEVKFLCGNNLKVTVKWT